MGNNPGNVLDPLGLTNPDGSPDTTDAIVGGLNVGFKAVFHTFTLGWYDGGDAKCDPDFATSSALAGIGRDALITAATLGAGEAFSGAGRAAEEAAEAGESSVGEPCGLLCFTADANVQMANGPPQHIADVQVGDKIKSRNPVTGQDEAKTVIATVKRIVPAVVTVSLTDAKTGQTEALTCTPEHPFFVTGQGWVEAGSLGIGSSIVSRAGPALSVTNVTWKRDKSKELAAGSSASTQGGYTVYNLTVEDDHTYFVGTTGGGTWVHNTLCDPTGSADGTLTKLANEIDSRYPGAVKGWGEGHMVNGAQVDIELDNALIEVKSGNGAGLTRQIIDRMNPAVNPNGLPVIGYASRMGAAARSINAAGGIAAGPADLGGLLDILAP